MSAEAELESALRSLGAALAEERLDEAAAELVKVLGLCAALRGANVQGAEVFASLRDVADQALGRAQLLRDRLADKLQQAGASRKAAGAYRNPRSAA